jgi:aldose 1-epimerase
MKITKEVFGRFNEYILSNPETGEAVNILPEFGGIIRKMVFRKEENLFNVIACADNDEQLIKEMAAYPSAHLFPWGNRVRDGKYSFEENTYQLPINEVALNNAIHGFVAFTDFEVLEEKVEETKVGIILRYQYKGNHFGFPFPFILDITNTLSANDGFRLTYSIKNTGEKTMPMVLGWHPYFKIEGENVSDWQIEFPAKLQSIPDKQMISVDTKGIDFTGRVALKTQNIDAVFAIEPAEKVKAVLFSPQKNVSVNLWQNGLEGQFTFMVVYIPPTRDCVAIEPMTGNTNAYNSGDGLMSLPVGETYQVSCGVFLS